ncbi:phage integrase family protein [Burkholderia gladioli]|uniref:phage integrase family protein n=1 Tax=Burkholderia gladioli TaxID=28095 RepID=UPI002158A92A|nr:phage integrase family protein [Burkholderia gladioli]MDN7466162.1 phage integrase family protein [Burkholderia gladioli]MDN7814398.1 phage integrase family protein [Burkholderia gladioli]
MPAEAHAGAGQGESGAAPVPPALEAYRDQVDPNHVSSERELLALYLEQFPSATSSPAVNRKVARNRSLRERQDPALAHMEAALVEAPRPNHLLEGCFAPAVVEPLAAAGVMTFDQLLGLIRRRRQRWYMAVPRLGAIGAARIVAFVDQHAESLGYLSPLAMTPRRQLPAGHAALQPAVRAPSDVAPLEALRVPAELDGSAGLNRARVPSHQAELNTDLQAVRAWTKIRGARSEATRRAYRREAERLLQWAIVVKRKPPSSLNTLDAAEYLEQFLADPQPAERWIGRNWADRFDPAWRPFVGPLSPRSRDTARRILTAMATTTHYTKGDAVRQYQTIEAFFNAALEGAGGSREDAVATDTTAPSTRATSLVDVHVALRVAPKREGGRGRGRVLERVKREVLAGIVHTPIQGDVTVLRLPFETEDDFDRRVDDLMVAIALTAEQHRCTSESSAWAEVAGER